MKISKQAQKDINSIYARMLMSRRAKYTHFTVFNASVDGVALKFYGICTKEEIIKEYKRSLKGSAIIDAIFEEMSKTVDLSKLYLSADTHTNFDVNL